MGDCIVDDGLKNILVFTPALVELLASKGIYPVRITAKGPWFKGTGTTWFHIKEWARRRKPTGYVVPRKRKS